MMRITTKIGIFSISPPDLHHLRPLTTSSKFLRKIPSSLDLKALFVFSSTSMFTLLISSIWSMELKINL